MSSETQPTQQTEPEILMWLDQAALDYEERCYRPTAHYIKLFKDAARLIRAQQRATLERMTVTQAAGSTELAKERLNRLAGAIVSEIMHLASKPLPVLQQAVLSVLERAGHDTFREGIILADQSVVEQLAVAIATIEELEKACDFHAGACDINEKRVRELKGYVSELEEKLAAAVGDRVEWLCTACNTVHPFQQPTIVQPCPTCKKAMEPSSPALRENARLRRQVEDLANDRAAADAEAAKLRQELADARHCATVERGCLEGIWTAVRRGEEYPGEGLTAIVTEYVKRADEAAKLQQEVEGLRNDVRQAEKAYENVLAANGDICNANRSYERDLAEANRRLTHERTLREDLDRRITALEQIPRIATELGARR